MQGRDGKSYPSRREATDRRRAAAAFLRQRGWSYRRIAQEMGWSVGTIYNDTSRQEGME